MKLHDRWALDDREQRPIRIGKTWRIDWDRAIGEWLKRIFDRSKKWTS